MHPTNSLKLTAGYLHSIEWLLFGCESPTGIIGLFSRTRK